MGAGGPGSEASRHAGEIEFTNNYSDLSTGDGFQFEFICNRCQNGCRAEFDAYELATATNLLQGAGSLLGGFFSQGASAAQQVKSAAREKASWRWRRRKPASRWRRSGRTPR